MLMKTLDKGAQPLRAEERADVERRFSALMKSYYDSVEARDPAPVDQLSQLDICITAKYQ